MNKKSALIILLLTSLALAIPLVAQKTINASPTANVGIGPSTKTVSGIETFTLNITIKDTGNICGWQAGFTFDPDVLQCLSVQEGDFLKGGGLTYWIPGTIDNAAGRVTYHACIILSESTVSGGGTLASVTLRAKAAGTSSIHLTDVIIVDPTPPTPQEAPVTTTDGIVYATVGGIVVPTDKLGTLAPYIGLTSILAATTAIVIYVKRTKKKQ